MLEMQAGAGRLVEHQPGQPGDVTVNLLMVPLSPGWPTVAAATTTTLGRGANRSRRRLEGILWMA